MIGRKLTRSPSRFVVGGIIGSALVAAGFAILGWKGGLFAAAVAVYEGWTLINPWPNDTLSEAIWEFAVRPMVPFLFGAASVWMIESGTLPNMYAAAAWFFLMGHFFFQAHDDGAPAPKKEV